MFITVPERELICFMWYSNGIIMEQINDPSKMKYYHYRRVTSTNKHNDDNDDNDFENNRNDDNDRNNTNNDFDNNNNNNDDNNDNNNNNNNGNGLMQMINLWQFQVIS